MSGAANGNGNVSKLEAAYLAAEEDERAEAIRVIGAVRFLAASRAHPDDRDLRSRLLDVIDGLDRAKAKTAAAFAAWVAKREAPPPSDARDANKTEQANDELASRRADARDYAERKGR